ncbi:MULTISPECIES: TRAP transporter small permease [Halomonas]|uniref:TRAP transporter small permease n=2 Tax=Halomonadaceae TaxID=28256 RepID=UPI001CD19E00|nr:MULTISPECIES: TRAP transporter small permease [Halomonas]MCA0914884.1 TRAP transporter small permease [Halomonas denitrificans]
MAADSTGRVGGDRSEVVVMKCVWKVVDNLENWLCQLLLVTFVVLLFAQILLRNLFSYSLPWADELATYAFVWFAYLGAVYAAKKSAHNRVTFQFRFLPRWVGLACGVLTDLIWVGFNLVFIWLSYDFVFHRMNDFWKSQTLGVPMKVFYLILPLAFVLMTLRIVQNNYVRFVQHREPEDPEAEAIEEARMAALSPSAEEK